MLNIRADSTSDQMRAKRHRTLEELAYANIHEWPTDSCSVRQA